MSAEAGWDVPPEADNGGGRTPSPARRSGRSRSPDARRMDVDDRRDDDRGRPPPGNNPGNNLHISGLSSRVEERQLEDVFAKYGRVEKCQVMRDPHTKDPRGFAFVTMSTLDEAEACISALTSTELEGKVITVEKARRGRARTPTPGTYHGPPKRPMDYPPPRGGGYDRRPRRDPYDDDRYYDRRPPPRSYRDDYRDRPRGGYDTYAAPMRDDRRADRSAAPPASSATGYDRYDRYDRYDDRRRDDDYYRRDRY